MYQTAATATTQ